jgi:hypothetical protein
LAYKYEGFAVGEVIRSQDFEAAGDASYIEGPILEIRLHGGPGRPHAHYVIHVTAECWKGQRVEVEEIDGHSTRVGHTGYVPMESFRDWEARVIRVGKTAA